MRRAGWAGVVCAVATVGGGAWSEGQDLRDPQGRRPRRCSVATLKGAYGIQMHGSRPSGPPPAPLESMIGVVRRVYDGQGGFTQLDNVKGSVNGIAPEPREGAGTYEVNADCSGLTRFDPGTGVEIVERLMIVNGGQEVFSIVATPHTVMVSTVQKKVR